MGVRATAMVGRLLVVACLAAATRLEAHPLHTTITEVTIDNSSGIVRATMRVFDDDLTGALQTLSRDGRSDVVVSDYVRSTLAIANQKTRISLRSCGVKRTAELLFVCVEGVGVRDVRNLSILNSALFEAFTDQVNIVRVSDGRRTSSLLFTRGDGAKLVR
jgi:hypothetical protein